MATENWTLVTVTGSYTRIDGSPAHGRIVFTPKAQNYVDQSSLANVLGRVIIAPLVNGSFSVQLPATNDPDIAPQNFTYRVQEMISGGREYHISVPVSAAVGGINLASVAPIDPGGGTVEVTVVPHQHPISDVASLQAALDAKAGSNHTHTPANVVGLQAELDAKAAAVHAHPISQLTATGTPDNTKFLRGDGTWSVPPSQPAGTTVEVDDPALTGIALRAGYILPAPEDAANTIFFLLPEPS